MKFYAVARLLSTGGTFGIAITLDPLAHTALIAPVV
jgi:hypothetical protein